MVALLTPGSLFGAYEIDTCIHENAALQFYAAKHFHSGADAIVVCFKHQSDFYRTAPDKRLSTILALHQKPMKRAVPLLDGGEWESVDWAAYAPPPSDAIPLSDVLMQHGALSEQCAAALVRDLLECLLASDHEHLRLRPSVLFLNANHALVAVAEHGIAELFPGAPLPFDPCIAPETRGKRFGPEADIFSCGVILYQALTGVEPFQDEGDHVARAITQDIPSITLERSDIAHAEAFDRLISMFVRRRFEDRPSLLQALQEARALALRLKAPPAAPIPHYDACFTADEALLHALDAGIPQSEPRPRTTFAKQAKTAPAPLASLPERKPLEPEEDLGEDEPCAADETKAMDAVLKAIAALKQAAEQNAQPQPDLPAASETKPDDSIEAALQTAPSAPSPSTAPEPPKRSKRSPRRTAPAQHQTSFPALLFATLFILAAGWGVQDTRQAETSVNPTQPFSGKHISTTFILKNKSAAPPKNTQEASQANPAKRPQQPLPQKPRPPVPVRRFQHVEVYVGAVYVNKK